MLLVTHLPSVGPLFLEYLEWDLLSFLSVCSVPPICG